MIYVLRIAVEIRPAGSNGIQRSDRNTPVRRRRGANSATGIDDTRRELLVIGRIPIVKEERQQLRKKGGLARENDLREGPEFWTELRHKLQVLPPSGERMSCSEPVDDSKGPIPEFQASLTESLDDLELRYIYKVYLDSKRNATKAGTVLGRDRRFVGRKVKEYERKLGASTRAV